MHDISRHITQNVVCWGVQYVLYAMTLLSVRQNLWEMQAWSADLRGLGRKPPGRYRLIRVGLVLSIVRCLGSFTIVSASSIATPTSSVNGPDYASSCTSVTVDPIGMASFFKETQCVYGGV
jgi:hypothetical protein